MRSPFPGMDPYLEGYLWSDVHNTLAAVIKELLVPQIRPKYVARVEPYTVSDSSPEKELGIMYPDVAVLEKKHLVEEAMASYSSQENTPLTPANLSLPILQPVEVRIPVIAIRDRGNNQLITTIEILSPVNKRSPGLEPHRKKVKKLQQANVHILEIDLLRRGERPLDHPQLPPTDYLVSLKRTDAPQVDLWTLSIRDPLPVVPIPLRSPDPDARLDLGQALRLIYQRSDYSLSIDYEQSPPPPVLSEEDQVWMNELLKNTDDN